MVLPTPSRSSPRRTTSTSGSSGIARRDGRSLEPRFECSPRGFGRLLFGLLLAPPDTTAVDALGHPDLGRERLLVVWATVLDDVLGNAEPAVCAHLLQAGLPVQTRTKPRGLLQEGVEQPVHDSACRLEADRQVDRPYHRLGRVREDRRLVAATG